MIIIFAVTLVVWTLSFLYFRNYLRRRTGSRRILEEFQEEVEKLIAEINASTDRGLTLMEDRISSLKTLLEETDRRISVYKRETEKRTINDRAYAEMGKKTLIKNDFSHLPPIIPDNRPMIAEQEIVTRGESSIAAETVLSQSTESVLPAQESSVEHHSELSGEVPRFIRSSIRVESKPPFAEQVLHLANAGFSNNLIAKHLGKSVAEVELAMALAERNKESE